MSDEETLRCIVELKERGETWASISSQVYLTPQAARSRYRRWIKQQRKKDDDTEEAYHSPLVEEFEEIVFHNSKKPEKIDWRELAKLATEVQSVNNRLEDTQEYAEISIETTRPVILMFTGDWHLGAAGTNHAGWAAQMETVLSTDGLYMINLGDYQQNAGSFRVLSVALSQILSPRQQATMFKGIIDELTEKNKLLASIIGNHDEFEERVLGQRLQYYLLERMKCPQFPNRGLVRLFVGDAEYSLLLLHKPKYFSSVNDTHGLIREYERDYPADVVAGGHNHKPAYQLLYRNTRAKKSGYDFGGPALLLAVGTWQEKSKFGYKHFHDGGLPISWYVVFDPSEKRFSPPFESLDDALLFREMWSKNGKGK